MVRTKFRYEKRTTELLKLLFVSRSSDRSNFIAADVPTNGTKNFRRRRLQFDLRQKSCFRKKNFTLTTV